jgi:hypothetical protein
MVVVDDVPGAPERRRGHDEDQDNEAGSFV